MTISGNRLLKLDAAVYHADPCAKPSLSSSIARVLERQSPLHAWSRHPRLGGMSSKPRTAFDFGSLSHALLLGEGSEIAIIEADDWRTKAAREAREEARAAGKVPVLVDDYGSVAVAVKTLRPRFADLGIVLDGKSEVTALWTVPAMAGLEVQCRGMIDHLTDGGCTVYDLKSCQSAHPDACARHADAYGYDIQHAAYVQAIETIHPELAGRVRFTFVFYELEPPYAVTPARLSGEFRELGQRRWERAVHTWAACLSGNRWPAYVDRIATLEAPRWALAKDSETQDGAVAAA